MPEPMPVPVPQKPIPTMADVLDAARFLRRRMPPTPLFESPLLSERVGTRVYVKCENHTAIASFKIRGALNYMRLLPAAARARGVVTASTGNHGQGMAYAGRAFGVPVTVYVPERHNPDKVAMIRALGAEVVAAGADFDVAKAAAREHAAARGLPFVDDGDEPAITAGAGTVALEIFQDLPDPAAVFVPVGNGALAGGVGVVCRALAPATRVVCVQSDAAPSMYLSWKAGRPVATPRADTFAEGIATRVPVPYALEVMAGRVDDFLLVSDEELRDGVRLLLETTHTLVEGAAAASVAGLARLAPQFAGRPVVLILTGGNVTLDGLRAILTS